MNFITIHVTLPTFQHDNLFKITGAKVNMDIRVCQLEFSETESASVRPRKKRIEDINHQVF